jgi:hypothetical protein
MFLPSIAPLAPGDGIKAARAATRPFRGLKAPTGPYAGAAHTERSGTPAPASAFEMATTACPPGSFQDADRGVDREAA